MNVESYINEKLLKSKFLTYDYKVLFQFLKLYQCKIYKIRISQRAPPAYYKDKNWYIWIYNRRIKKFTNYDRKGYKTREEAINDCERTIELSKHWKKYGNWDDLPEVYKSWKG